MEKLRFVEPIDLNFLHPSSNITNTFQSSTLDRLRSRQNPVIRSNPASPNHQHHQLHMNSNAFSPNPSRRQMSSIQRPIPTFPPTSAVNFPGGLTGSGNIYSAFTPFSGADTRTTAASVNYENATRPSWSRLRQHRSLDGESLQLLNESFGFGDTMPPADPQVSMNFSQAAFHHLPHSPRYHSQGNLISTGLSASGGMSSSMQQQPMMSSSYGQSTYNSAPFTSALLAGISGLNLENVQQQQHQHNPYQQHQQALNYSNVGTMDTSLVLNPTVTGRDPYSMSLPVLQREYEILRKEYENAVHKLHSTMGSIKTFWSPELKKERGLRKEEATKFSLIQEQLKMANQENQKQAALVHQLQDELHCQYELSRTIRNTDVQSVPREEYEATRIERDRLHRELALAKDSMREVELQVETQRQTLVSRDESIKKLLDMLQSKGLIPFGAVQDRLELETAKSRLIEAEKRSLHFEALSRQKDQDIRMLQDECLSASEKIKQQQMQYDRFQRLPMDARESGALHAY